MPDDWPFDQEKNAAAVTTLNVMENGLPVLVVTHYADDHSWAFLCGTTNQAADGRVISMGEVLELDPTLKSIADLPPGWMAWREKVGSLWKRDRQI